MPTKKVLDITKLSQRTADLTGLFGYLGATVGSLATGYLADRYGWNGVVWFYAGSAVLGCALLALTWSRRGPAAA